MSQALGRRWPLFLLLLLPLVPLWPLLTGKVLGPWDQIATMAPWNAQPPGTSWDILQADGVLQFYVWRDMVFESWRRFEPPFWNHYSLMGTPLLANSQSGGFYPLHIVAGVLQLPTGLAINLLAWVHLAVGGIGLYRLARLYGASQEGAAFGGSALILSTFLLGWLPLASVGTTCAWIPWVLGFVTEVFRSDCKKTRAFIGLALSTGMMVLGGHLQFAFYGLLGAGLVALVLGVQAMVEKKLKPASAAGAIFGLILGLALAAPQLVPVMNYSRFSHRAGTATAEGYQGYVRNALAPWEVPGLVFPSLMGFPGQKSPAFEDQPLPAFWPAYVRPGAAFSESAWGVGPLVLGLLLLLRKKQLRDLLPMGILGGVAFLLAMGTPLNAALYFGVPGWSATGSPGRVMILLVVALCALAAIAWPRDLEEGEAPPDYRLAYGGLAGFALLALLAFSVFQGGLTAWAQGLDAKVIASKQLVAGLPLALLSLGAGAGALWLISQGKKMPSVLAGAASVAFLGTSLSVPFGQVAFQRDPEGAPSRVAHVNTDWGFLQTPRAFYPPNSAAAARRTELGGYDSLLHRDTVAILNDINGEDSAPQTNGNIMHIKPTADVAKLKEAGVERICALPGVELSPELGALPEAEPGCREVGGTLAQGATVAYKGGRALAATVPAPGPVEIKVRAMPGWSVAIDGKSQQIPEGKWIAFEAPGAGEYLLTYTPPGLSNGLGLALGAALVLIGVGLMSRRKGDAPAEQSANES